MSSEFFSLGRSGITVRGIKPPYPDLDLQGEMPSSVTFDPRMLHMLSQLYGVDVSGTPHAIKSTQNGSLWVADAGPAVNFNECYEILITDSFAHVQQFAQPVSFITMNLLGSPTDISLSYNGDKFVVWHRLDSREFVAIAGQIKAIQYQAYFAPAAWYTSVLKVRTYYTVPP